MLDYLVHGVGTALAYYCLAGVIFAAWLLYDRGVTAMRMGIFSPLQMLFGLWQTVSFWPLVLWIIIRSDGNWRG